jgi:hypothetical protein
MPKKRTDLTGYAALYGESFSSRIDLVEKIIGGAHYPSIGHYKERLLAKAIRDYLPKAFEVGTGFVLFPHEDENPPGGVENHDALNKSAFSLSRQCDILVYDAHSIPPVFKDEEFVIVRPEAVIAVIEVKGSLSLKETRDILESSNDFGMKWQRTQTFYNGLHVPSLKPPVLMAMAWKIKSSSPTKIRECIGKFYKEFPKRPVYPILDTLLIYNECEISFTYVGDSETGHTIWRDGWYSRDGRFTRFNEQKKPYRDKDRTVASLLARLQLVTGEENFNRFFSYMDETNKDDLISYEHRGFTPVWDGGQGIK